jgi:hypothetical protein
MTSSIPERHISIIGSSYLYPITSLIEILQPLEPKGSNDLQTSAYENGYAVSIIILTVLLVESIVAKVQKDKSVNPAEIARNPVKFIVETYPDSDFAHKFHELFVVRDVIAHNHVWEAEFVSDSEGNMELVGDPTLQLGYGDKKYRNTHDILTKQTKLLRINLYPTRICYSDVLIVLKTTVDFLLFLEKESRSYIYLSNQRVTCKGERILFVDLIRNL